MVLENVTAQITSIFNQLSVEGARMTLEPLILFLAGMIAYSLFIFKFYRFISRRDLFKIREGSHSKLGKLAYALKYMFLFPIAAFLWFFVISILLSMLSAVLTIGNVFMISMAILATVRITSYLHEDLSSEIAKIVPFALLGAFLLDITAFSTSTVFKVIEQLPSIKLTVVYYFIFIFSMEILLKIFLGIKNSGNKKAKSPDTPKHQKP